MPRGDKPTTPALALKDGWIYEDTLPASITKEEYDWWFRESLVLDGVRMGPPLATKPQSTTETLEVCPCNSAVPLRIDRIEVGNWIQVVCDNCGRRGAQGGSRWMAEKLWNQDRRCTAPVVSDE